METRQLELKANEIRTKIWRLIYATNTGHTSSGFSCTDILVALYYRVLNQTVENFGTSAADVYIQSKGHAVEPLFEILADKRYFPENDLKDFSGFNTHYIGHPTNAVNGIEMNTGSLGHGLGLAVGVALAAKMDQLTKQVYVLMGDGEQAEGSVWEAAMAASNYDLNNLTAIIDFNQLQISGKTSDVMNTNSLAQKYEAFGWETVMIDGNDIQAIVDALSNQQKREKPLLILAKTVKGKGISFMEDKAVWHHKVPNESEFEKGLLELSEAREGLLNDK